MWSPVLWGFPGRWGWVSGSSWEGARVSLGQAELDEPCGVGKKLAWGALGRTWSQSGGLGGRVGQGGQAVLSCSQRTPSGKASSPGPLPFLDMQQTPGQPLLWAGFVCPFPCCLQPPGICRQILSPFPLSHLLAQLCIFTLLNSAPGSDLLPLAEGYLFCIFGFPFCFDYLKRCGKLKMAQQVWSWNRKKLFIYIC